MKSQQKVLLTGVKPTGQLHVGNYFGAIQQVINLQDTYASYVFIADYHALNTLQNAAELQKNILNITIDYIALGLDPNKVVFYKQSDVSAHTELAWIFNTLTTMPYLMRAHAYKDAEAKNKEINVGTFDYPMLMAADILLYDADVVPVGQDQKQHVEIARDTAEKFNRIYGETFKLPKELILDTVKTVIGTDGRKMSKSYNNTLPLFADDEAIKKTVMSIPTDSRAVSEPKDIEHDTVYALHKLFTSGAELEEVTEKYTHGGMSYKESKELLVKNIQQFISPKRQRRAELATDTDAILDILSAGGKKAKKIADKKMMMVKKNVGVNID